MNLKKWIQLILVGASAVTLVACSSAHKYRDPAAVNDANSAYSDARSSGAGDESSFGDGPNAASHKRLSSNDGKVYYFDYDSNIVHDSDKPAIDNHASYLSANNSSAMLEGHTDPRGSREYNIALGERRAKSVAEIMTSKGVDPSKVRIVSYGAEKLASNGYNEADYQKDRRVVLNVQR